MQRITRIACVKRSVGCCIKTGQRSIASRSDGRSGNPFEIQWANAAAKPTEKEIKSEFQEEMDTLHDGRQANECMTDI